MVALDLIFVSNPAEDRGRGAGAGFRQNGMTKYQTPQQQTRNIAHSVMSNHHIQLFLSHSVRLLHCVSIKSSPFLFL